MKAYIFIWVTKHGREMKNGYCYSGVKANKIMEVLEALELKGMILVFEKIVVYGYNISFSTITNIDEVELQEAFEK